MSVTVRYGIGNEVNKEFASIQEILDNSALLDLLGCPDNIEARINGAKVEGGFQLANGAVVDLVAGVNEKA